MTNFLTSQRLPIVSGVGTVGYKVVDRDGTTAVARTTMGIVEIQAGSASSLYGADVLAPDGFTGGWVVWDDADGSYAWETIVAVDFAGIASDAADAKSAAEDADTKLGTPEDNIAAILSTLARTGDAMALTSAERTAFSAVIEGHLINDADGTALMQAILNKINTLTTSDVSTLAIATATRDSILNRVLSGNHDTTGTTGKVLQFLDELISSRLADADYQPPDNDGIADAVSAATAAASAASTASGAAQSAATSSASADTKTTSIKLVTDKFATMLTADGSNSKYTPAALQEAPSSDGGGGGVSGPGADQVTLTISQSGNPIPDAGVWITSDSAGKLVVAGTLQTDSEGKVLFLLDAGNTYYLWMQKDGSNPILGQSFVAVADT